MSGEIVFVLSDTRSGSTLVDQLLGAHPSILSLGEVHWLRAYVLNDRTIYDPVHPLICACGDTVPECSFWRDVAQTLGRSLDSLELRLRLLSWKDVPDAGGISRTLRQFPRRCLQALPSAFRNSAVQRVFGGQRMATDSLALFDAIFEVSGSPYLVDASKLPFRFRAIYDRQPARVRTILLGRDYRAVVHSKMKRGRSLEAGAIGWRRRMTEIAALTVDVPVDRQCRVRYEDLCVDPEGELTRICTFLGLQFSPVMLRRPTSGIHHIGGSPSKFDLSKQRISMDTAYQTAFDAEALAKLRHLVGDVGRTWGYG